MYSALDPEMLYRFIYSHLSLVIPPSPCLPELGRRCVLREREVDRPTMTILHAISVPQFPSGPLLYPRHPPASLSLLPDIGPLCLLSRPRQDELAVQRRSSTPHHVPPRLSDASSWVSFCRGLQLLSHPTPPCCWWYTA